MVVLGLLEDLQFKIVFQTSRRLSLKQILYVIFVVCVDDKNESFLQSSFPVDFILELIEIRLEANLSGENLLSE